MTNEEIIQKVTRMESIFKATSTASTGVMNEEQAKTFIQEVKDESELLTIVDAQQMNAEKKKLYSMGLEKRLLRKGVKGVDPDVVDLDKKERMLDTVETIMAINIYFEDIEDSIEQGTYEETVNSLITKAFANDLADLAINGREATVGDNFLSINDGYLEIADTDTGIHAIPISGNDTPKDIFNAMLRAMPNKWKTNPADLIYLVSPGRSEDYLDQLGDRATLMGDKSIVTKWNPGYKGVTVKSINHMPDTRVLLTDPMNLAYGIYKRNIRVGKWVNERKRRIEYTITHRSDAEYKVSDLIVLGTQV